MDGLAGSIDDPKVRLECDGEACSAHDDIMFM